MLAFGLKILLVIIVALIASIVIIVKVIRSKRHKIYLLIALVPFGLAWLVGKILTHAPMRLYVQDYQEVTGTEMPADAKILYKSATIPPVDEHASHLLITVGREVYTDLPNKLIENGLTETPDSFPSWLPSALSEHNLRVVRSFQIKEHNIDHGAYLLSDSATVFIHRQKY